MAPKQNHEVDITLEPILELLLQMQDDESIPKNVRLRIDNAIVALKDTEKARDVKINRSLQELDDLNDNNNIPAYTRAQIWNIVSTLESIQG